MNLTLQEKIKKLRKNKNLTQSELANIAGVTKTAVYNWERGSYSPDGDNLIKLAEALGTTVSYLLGETDVWAHGGEMPESQRTPEEWESIRDEVSQQGDKRFLDVKKMGRYADPELGIYEIIGDMAKMQEATRRNYKHFYERELIVLSSQLDAYKGLINKIRALEPWKDLEER